MKQFVIVSAALAFILVGASAFTIKAPAPPAPPVSGEVVLQTFSAAEIAAHESLFTTYTTVASAEIINIANSQLSFKVTGVPVSGHPSVQYFAIADCGGCSIRGDICGYSQSMVVPGFPLGYIQGCACCDISELPAPMTISQVFSEIQ
ncbi:MAG: hypothetical protein AAGB22_07590 [Bacteroidota bacterium]